MLGRVSDLYSRFEIARPDYLGDDHWACIQREADRLGRSLDVGDGSQALSDIKCLVESISRVVLEIDGTPAAPNAGFDTVVNQAHALLTGQPGQRAGQPVPVRSTRNPGEQDREKPGHHPKRVWRWSRPRTNA